MSDTTITCSTCSKPQKATIGKEGPKLPKGWKRTDAIYCDKCWRERYVLRAITMEVLRPLGDGVGWDDLREAVRISCGQATSVTNWIMGRMFAADRPRLPSDSKLGKLMFDGKPLYHECREAWPDFRASSLAALMNSLGSKYRKRRYEILWTGESSLPSARYPQPYPVHNRDWKPLFAPAGVAGSAREYWEEVTDTDRDTWLAQAQTLMAGKKDKAILRKAQMLAYKDAGKVKVDNGSDLVPAVEVPLVGGKMLLQLRQGKDWRGQLSDFRKFVSGEAIKGELTVINKRVGGNGSDHGNGTTKRDDGGQRVRSRIMVKMVGWFPRTVRPAVSVSLFLMVACKETASGMSNVRVWHWEHLRRWVAEHKRRLQQWSDDQKAEQRHGGASFASRREAASFKYRNRMQSAQKELAHQVAEVCRRQRVAEVVYDDKDCGYFGGDKWTWSAFETCLANKLNEIGVLFKRKGSDGE
jgi:hypothetical protein